MVHDACAASARLGHTVKNLHSANSRLYTMSEHKMILVHSDARHKLHGLSLLHRGRGERERREGGRGNRNLPHADARASLKCIDKTMTTCVLLLHTVTQETVSKVHLIFSYRDR